MPVPVVADGTDVENGPPSISVIVATYCPGPGLDRVIASLDAQTLPQSEFETIFVDDGSPDDTVDRLRLLAATRPNVHIERIDNSGWPSRPRNVGIALAQGRWAFFMDHDDSLYPDALRRMRDYATETDAQVLSPKESKTTDAWWGISGLVNGDVSDATRTGGIGQLLPMVPHKLYSLEFLRTRAITFPEGRRRLWEDIYFNVQAWSAADRVAILADTPVYLWHSSGSNNSKTYGPRSTEYWHRLDDLCAFIDTTLGSVEHADARRAALLHQYRSRVLVRLSRDLALSTADERDRAMHHAAAIQARYIDRSWERSLSRAARARAVLLRKGRADLLEELWAADQDLVALVRATGASWVDGRLRIELTGEWRHRDGRRLVLRRDGDSGNAIRHLSPGLTAALPREVIDFGNSLSSCTLEVALRERDEHVTWPLRLDQQVCWTELEDGRTPVVTAVVFIDPTDNGHGSPVSQTVFDVIARMRWNGLEAACSVAFSGRSAPAMLGAAPAVAYRSRKGTLALDLSGRLRNPIADGGAFVDRNHAGLADAEIELPRVTATSPAETLVAVQFTSASAPEVRYRVAATLVTDGRRAWIRFAENASVPPGRYLIAFRIPKSGRFLGHQRCRIRRRTLRLMLQLVEGRASPRRLARVAIRTLAQERI